MMCGRSYFLIAGDNYWVLQLPAPRLVLVKWSSLSLSLIMCELNSRLTVSLHIINVMDFYIAEEK